MARQQVIKAGQHDVVGLALDTKVADQPGARPGHRARLRQHGTLERREIAQAHKLHAAIDGLGHGLVADAREDAREAISPSRDQRHVGPAGRCAVNGGKARGVITGKARVHGLGIGVHFHLVAHGLQARNAALERGLVADGASGRVDVDVLGAVVVFAVRRVVVVGQSVQARQRPAP